MTEQQTMDQPAVAEPRQAADLRSQPGLAAETADPAEQPNLRRATAQPDPETGAATSLLDAAASRDLRERWSDVQAGFVDEPRSSVERADALVAEAMRRLAKGFTRERESLEAQRSRGDDVSTEDLRVALQRYRSFFDRLLSI